MKAPHSIERARRWTQEHAHQCDPAYLPRLHAAPPLGWINDPNGFSFFQGRYHLYGQHNPYDSKWDNMHWCHWTSEDMLHWQWEGVAMAPDKPYDCNGCFSGTALVEDELQIVAYTGVSSNANGEERQTQCLAFSRDGSHLQKCADNPVIAGDLLPQGASVRDFRDPKLMRTSSGYRILAANAMDGQGCIQSFSSTDLKDWAYEGCYLHGQGKMMECPDCFSLGNETVLIVCIFEGIVPGLDSKANNAPVLAYIGQETDGGRRLLPRKISILDYGSDFYAPQTVKTPDGRRVLIGWMYHWPGVAPTHRLGHGWAGQMTIPRELSIRQGKLYQQPVRELLACRRDHRHYAGKAEHVAIALDETADVCLELSDIGRGRVEIRCHEDADEFFAVRYDAESQTLSLDGSACGYAMDEEGEKRLMPSANVPLQDGKLSLRLIIDRASVEVFAQDGETVMSAQCFPKRHGRNLTLASPEKAFAVLDTYALF